MKIEGIPEGYEIQRVGRPDKGDLFISGAGEVIESAGREVAHGYVIVRKIERPKQYSPFTSAEEFRPHRDRWCRIGVCESRVQDFNQDRVYFRDVKFTWGQAFIEITFDDGSPFGVEVSE